MALLPRTSWTSSKPSALDSAAEIRPSVFSPSRTPAVDCLEYWVDYVHVFSVSELLLKCARELPQVAY